MDGHNSRMNMKEAIIGKLKTEMIQSEQQREKRLKKKPLLKE